MKKLLTITFAIFIAAIGNAQFILTPNGFKTSDGKDYYVIERSNLSQKNLFEQLEAKIMANYGSRRDDSRITSTPFSELTLKTVERKKLVYYGKKFNIDFQTSFDLKDGKIRVNAPVIEKIYLPENDSRNSVLYIKLPANKMTFNGAGFTIIAKDMYVYDKKSKLKNKQLKQLLENVFNQQILAAILPSADKSDW